MRLAIIGSRDCPNIEIENYLKYLPDTIVSGGARGADTYAREFAIKHNLKLIEFYPEYSKYGRGAPIVRNKLIVEASDCIIAFWDGKSKGTKFTLEYARQLHKPIKIVNYLTNEINIIK